MLLTTAQIHALALVFARHEADMSQADLAAAMGGKDKQRIANIESGKENITEQYLDQLLTGLNISHHRFIELQFEAVDILLQNQEQMQSNLN